MTELNDIAGTLDEKIKIIQDQVLSGQINLLDYELVPIFTQLKNLITIQDLDKNSKSYKQACNLLNQKFEELKGLLSSLDNEKKFMEYLKLNPNDEEIGQLFEGCWRETFSVNPISLDFLELSTERLGTMKRDSLKIEHLDKTKAKGGRFLLEIPEHNFSENMLKFYDEILNKLPCPFEDIFEDENDQLKIYEKFVFILHLLQSGKIKYQKETNTLYI